MKKFLIGIVSAGLIATAMAAGSNVVANARIDTTPDCDTVAIIKCGAFSERELRGDFERNAYGDAPKVYAAFGIQKSELNGFSNGVVWRDGRVTVNGKTVATNAVTAGRWNNPANDMTRIPGTQRAYKMDTRHFVDNGQAAFVKVVNGEFKFAVIKSCGNPVSAKPTPKPEPPKPEYACDGLKREKISRTKFRFTADAHASKGAEIKRYRFDFGDGKSATGTDKTVTHTYAEAGTYNVKVTAIVNVSGQLKEVSGGQCKVAVTVQDKPAPKPEYACTSLKVESITKTKFAFTATSQLKNAELVRYVFVVSKDGTEVARKNDGNGKFTYVQENPGTYAVQAFVTVKVNGEEKTVTADTCKAEFTIEQTPEECKPGIPVGDERCTEQPEECKPGIPVGDDRCEETPEEPEECKPGIPMGHPDCEPVVEEPEEEEPIVEEEEPEQVLPETIAETGPAQMLMGATGLSSLTAASYYWLQSRRKLRG